MLLPPYQHNRGFGMLFADPVAPMILSAIIEVRSASINRASHIQRSIMQTGSF
uniref:Uncharacterized protein n=1 Tax=Lotus japonicus TaxID=34305 RepID=I3T2M2_LOTJA|nr:unknown [Lotus japonicus]